MSRLNITIKQRKLDVKDRDPAGNQHILGNENNSGSLESVQEGKAEKIETYESIEVPDGIELLISRKVTPPQETKNLYRAVFGTESPLKKLLNKKSKIISKQEAIQARRRNASMVEISHSRISRERADEIETMFKP